MLWSFLGLQLLMDVPPATFELLLHRVQLDPVQLQMSEVRYHVKPSHVTLLSDSIHLTLHLCGEFVDDFVPVLLLARHLVEQLVEHGVELLRHRVKLQAAHFALQSRFICFLQVWRDNKTFRTVGGLQSLVTIKYHQK